jgi:hypothetical protein
MSKQSTRAVPWQHELSMQLAVCARADDDRQPAGGLLSCRLHVPVRHASPLRPVSSAGSRPLHQSPQGFLHEVAAIAVDAAGGQVRTAIPTVISRDNAAMDVGAVGGVARQDEHVADAAAEGGHLGAERAEAQRAQRLYELREEVGPVVAADRGLEHGAARGEHHDLVVLRREQVRRRRLTDAGQTLLQVPYPLHRLRQQRRLVYLHTSKQTL